MREDADVVDHAGQTVLCPTSRSQVATSTREAIIKVAPHAAQVAAVVKSRTAQSLAESGITRERTPSITACAYTPGIWRKRALR